MGLFDKMKKTANDAKQRMDEAKSQIDQAKAHLETAQSNAKRAVGAVTGKEDVRPFVPPVVQMHRSNDCIEVRMCGEYQEQLRLLNPGVVNVALVKPKKGYPYDGFDGLLVYSPDRDFILGGFYKNIVDKYGLKAGHKAVCEVAYPQYRWEEDIQLFMRLTDEQKAVQKAKDDMKLWINIDAKKWEIEHGERFEFQGGEILSRQVDDKKPVFIIMGENRKLFEVNSRMKVYTDIEERAGYKIRKLIAEFKNGDYGPYYHVGFYY